MIAGKHRVAVVGPGAIGTTIAAALHQNGKTPLLAGRSARPDLTLLVDERTTVVPGPVLESPPRENPGVDVVFFCVKATQTERAATWLRALSRPGTIVCVLQNGIEQIDAVAPYAEDCEVVPGIVWFPAERADDGSVRLRGAPRVTLPDVPGASVLLDVLRGSMCAVDIADDFTTQAWRKLLQNAVAGLMALTLRRAGMFARADIADLARGYLLECVAVAAADGARLDGGDAAALLAKFRAFPDDMGTSILADREKSRPLEWDVRNGVIQRRGRAHGIQTPISDVIVPLLAAASDGPG